MEVLIADSGGTKTDWCYIDSNGNQFFFSTESYHPANWNESFWKRIAAFWNEHCQYLSAKLMFYGSGCLNEGLASELSSQFSLLGFLNPLVKSDLFAAGKSVLKNDSGSVAILGTGSVLFYFNGHNVESIVGGKGHVEGDEGSGYYFGKLVLDALNRGELTKEQENIFLDCADVNTIQSSIGTDSEKFEVANISSKLGFNQEAFIDFHTLNINSFYTSHNSGIQTNELYLVGSYAYYHQVIIKKILSEFDVEIKGVIQKPIMRLVEQTVSFIE